MKKILCSFLLFVFVLASSACTAEKDVNITVSAPASSAGEASSEKTVSLVISKYVAEITGIDLTSQTANSSIADIEKNKDGSFTFHLTPENKKKMQIDLKKELTDYLQMLSTNTDWPFIEKAEINETYDHVTILATNYKAERDQKVAAAIYAPVVLYRAFAELATDETFVLQFSVIDAKSFASAGEFSYPQKADPTPKSKTDGSDQEASPAPKNE
ncbi:MAG: hypothetical protein RSC76_04750 [Oscillospiraceae bacterium]